MPLSTRINGHVQQVDVIEGQMVHTGDVLAVLDQKEYGIAVYQAIANLAYAENTAASLYYSAAITVTTAYGGLNSARSTVKNAQAEVAAAENQPHRPSLCPRRIPRVRLQLANIRFGWLIGPSPQSDSDGDSDAIGHSLLQVMELPEI